MLFVTVIVACVAEGEVLFVFVAWITFVVWVLRMDIEVVEITKLIVVGLMLDVGESVLGLDGVLIVDNDVFVLSGLVVVDLVFDAGFVVIAVVEASVVTWVVKFIVDWPVTVDCVVEVAASATFEVDPLVEV